MVARKIWIYKSTLSYYILQLNVDVRVSVLMSYHVMSCHDMRNELFIHNDNLVQPHTLIHSYTHTLLHMLHMLHMLSTR